MMLFLLVFASTPHDFLPCTAGLEVEYRTGSDATVVDVVAGIEERNGQRICRIERVVTRQAKRAASEASGDGCEGFARAGPEDRGKRSENDPYLREILPDRVLSAGYAATPLAQRPPLLLAPIEVGRHWQFNRARYRITALGPCAVGELSFDRCVTIEMSGDDGSKNMSRYAEGVGLVEQSFGSTRMIAIAVRMPKSTSGRKTPARAR